MTDAVPTMSVGVSHRGERRTWQHGDTAATSTFPIASLTKTVTAVAAVRAASRAGIPVETLVLDVLPDLRIDWRADRAITLSDLLAQVSGLRAEVTAADVAELGHSPGALLEAARLVGRAGSEHPRGVRWEYYNGNYFVVGAVIAALTGGSYEDAVESLVLQPWGMSTTRFAPDDEYPRARRPSGGLCSTVADLLTFGERLLADEDLIRTVALNRTSGNGHGYGFGWAIGPAGQLYLNGRLPGQRNAVVAVPGERFVAVALCPSTDGLPAAAAALSDLQLPLTGVDLTDAIDSFAL